MSISGACSWTNLLAIQRVVFEKGEKKRKCVSSNKSTTSTINGAQTVPPHKL